jgi:RNA polymerase sigma-70 factor (ECF subfamily)
MEVSSPKGGSGRAQRHPEERLRGLALVDRQVTPEERLHTLLAPTVNRLVWTFLRADPERDDIAQEIFIRIFRGAAKVRDPDKLEPWAARVAMNCIKNEFRRRRFRRWVSLSATHDPEQSRCHEDFEGRELLQRAYVLLDKLPVRERLPLTLQLLENVDLERIAELCECSSRTAKRRLKSARERFERLARQDPALVSRLSSSVANSEDRDG